MLLIGSFVLITKTKKKERRDVTKEDGSWRKRWREKKMKLKMRKKVLFPFPNLSLFTEKKIDYCGDKRANQPIIKPKNSRFHNNVNFEHKIDVYLMISFIRCCCYVTSVRCVLWKT